MKVQFLAIALISALILVGLAGMATAEKKDKTDHVYLYEVDNNQQPIEGSDSWGKMTYFKEGLTFKFVFNGHDLEAGKEYELRSKGINIAKGIANSGGELHIQGSVELNKDIVNGRMNLWNIDSDPHGFRVLRSFANTVNYDDIEV